MSICIFIFCNSYKNNITTLSQVIAAEGEQKASKALREASIVMAESSSALQLRYLQVLKQMYICMIHRAGPDIRQCRVIWILPGIRPDFPAISGKPCPIIRLYIRHPARTNRSGQTIITYTYYVFMKMHT